MIKLLELEEERRNAILNSALKEFSLRGFAKASTNVIAKEAGISKPLMFHYIGNKQELFSFLYTYFLQLIEKEYTLCMNYDDMDIVNRLRQSYSLQLNLMKKFPWILEFHKLFVNAKDMDNEENVSSGDMNCYPTLFDAIDESKFRAGLDIEKSKQIIYWAFAGFTNEIVEDLRTKEYFDVNYTSIMKEIDDLCVELKQIFYAPEYNGKKESL